MSKYNYNMNRAYAVLHRWDEQSNANNGSSDGLMSLSSGAAVSFGTAQAESLLAQTRDFVTELCQIRARCMKRTCRLLRTGKSYIIGFAG